MARRKQTQSKEHDGRTTNTVSARHKDTNEDEDQQVYETDRVKSPSPVSRLKSQEEVSMLIAELSESILQDPSKAFHATEDTTTATAASNPNADETSTAANGKDKQQSTTGNQRKQQIPSPVQQLFYIVQNQQQEEAWYTVQLAILSLLAIFQDIMPSYRIRQPTEAEKSVQVSRETKALWDYERLFLTYYKQYISLLQTTAAAAAGGLNLNSNGKRTTNDQKKQQQLAISSQLCACELFKKAYHFNFRSQLLKVVLKPIHKPSCPASVLEACCQAIEHVFEHDAQGEMALETCRMLSKSIHERNEKVSPRVLKTFIKLPLRVHLDEMQAVKLAAAAMKKKRSKELKEIDAEMQEGEATVDKMALARAQSDTLESITVTYFRILKQQIYDHQKQHSKSQNQPKQSYKGQSSQKKSDLFMVALEGLAKFAALINMDTVQDLMVVLKDLLQTAIVHKEFESDEDVPENPDLSVEAALQCIWMAFYVLQGPGKTMAIDSKEYIVPLYSQLHRLIFIWDSNGDDCNDMKQEIQTTTRSAVLPLLLKCLSAALEERREFSTLRVAAFFKQLISVALGCSTTGPSHAIALLAFARKLGLRYPSALAPMLDSEIDTITSGTYNPLVRDPEHSNPWATSAWESSTLQFHIHPAIRGQAVALAKQQMLKLPKEDPQRLYQEELGNRIEGYIPFERNRKKHPLAESSANAGEASNKKRRRRGKYLRVPVSKESDLEKQLKKTTSYWF